MRSISLIALVLAWTHVLGQRNVTGTVIDIQTGDPIIVRKEGSQFFLLGDKTISVPIDSTGHFTIEEAKLLGLGDTLTMSIGTLGTDHYADFEMINIPRDRIREATTKIFVTKAYWIPSCGADCFTVNNKRTYKKKSITVDNGEIKYIMWRTPIKRPSNNVLDPVKYRTDFLKDLI
jgi:hypothetical protein